MNRIGVNLRYISCNEIDKMNDNHQWSKWERHTWFPGDGDVWWREGGRKSFEEILEAEEVWKQKKFGSKMVKLKRKKKYIQKEEGEAAGLPHR